ncbi:MAG: triose-phosphate isomerase [Pseudomonadota bacterium]
MRRKIAAGNWKMNGTQPALDELSALAAACPEPAVSVVICPPATLLHRAAQAMSDHAIAIGAQDCHAAASGAHTGDISVDMIADAGGRFVIVGHSERRQDHGETDPVVCDKAAAAMAFGLTAIICVGETLEQREAGETLAVISSQIAGSVPDSAQPDTLVIAYEPVWAIGTGRIPTLSQIGEVHDAIRADLEARFGSDTGQAIPLLYGGSVKPANATDIFAVANVDGALVGGASLKADDFAPIVEALAASD